MTPDEFIQKTRKTFGRYPDLSGGCLKFAQILKGLYNGTLYADENHVITRINGKYYDIDGEHDPKGFKIMTDADIQAYRVEYEGI